MVKNIAARSHSRFNTPLVMSKGKTYVCQILLRDNYKHTVAPQLNTQLMCPVHTQLMCVVHTQPTHIFWVDPAHNLSVVHTTACITQRQDYIIGQQGKPSSDLWDNDFNSIKLHNNDSCFPLLDFSYSELRSFIFYHLFE